MEGNTDYFTRKKANGLTLAMEDCLRSEIDVFEIPFEYRTEELYEALRSYYRRKPRTDQGQIEVGRALFERQLLNDISTCVRFTDHPEETGISSPELKRRAQRFKEIYEECAKEGCFTGEVVVK